LASRAREIQEVFLQAAIYCGVPAANSAFHAAEEVFERLDSKDQVARRFPFSEATALSYIAQK
jgi:hypothetical protein